MKIIFITLSLVIIGSLFSIYYIKKINEYKIIFNKGPNHSKADFGVSVDDGIKFIKLFTKEYLKTVDDEVHPKFKKDFLLLKSKKVSAKLVISSFGESLTYLYPDNKSQVTIDFIDFPVQTALCFGFIDLNNPSTKVDLSKIDMKGRRLDSMIKAYKAHREGVNFTSGNGGSIFSSAKLIFNNSTKIFQFHEKTISGFLNEITFKQNNDWYLQIYGKEGSHNYKINGVLLITSEKTFDWTFELAKEIGKQMAEIEIINFIKKSKFFKLAMADKKLRPKAEIIAQKLSRSEQEKKAFPYPIWAFKQDVFQLKKDAEQIGIDSSYVDELLKEPSLKTVDGTLFVYFSSKLGFMTQWSMMNLFFMICIVLLAYFKFHEMTILFHLLKLISALKLKVSIITIITIANSWVFAKKPASIPIKYWLLPCALYFLCVVFIIYLMNNYSDSINKSP